MQDLQPTRRCHRTGAGQPRRGNDRLAYTPAAGRKMVREDRMPKWPRAACERNMAVEHRPSTTREKLLEISREELAPHKSLEAVAEASGRVVGAVSVAATLVAALGLVSATSLSDAGWGWALPTVVLSAISVALAVWATVPSRARVRPGDLEDVQQFFDGQIKRRGCFVQAAAITFGLAVLLTPLPALAAALQPSPSAVLNVSAIRRGTEVAVTIVGEHLPHDAVVTMTLEDEVAHGLLLYEEVGFGGRTSATAEVPLTSLDNSRELRLLARHGTHVIANRTIPVPGG